LPRRRGIFGPLEADGLGHAGIRVLCAFLLRHHYGRQPRQGARQSENYSESAGFEHESSSLAMEEKHLVCQTRKSQKTQRIQIV
jgi:hypothetical protein